MLLSQPFIVSAIVILLIKVDNVGAFNEIFGNTYLLLAHLVFCVFSCICYFSNQSPEVHATCSSEASGKHANALGADSRCQSFVSHYWSNQFCG